LRKSKHVKKAGRISLRQIGIIGAILAIISLVLAIVGALLMGVLPLKYFLIVFLIDAAATGALTFFLFRKKTPSRSRLICLILALLIAILNVFIFVNSIATASFLDTADEDNANELEYSVVAWKDSGIKPVPDEDLTVGIWGGDLYDDLVRPEVEKLCKPAYTESDDARSLLESAEKKEFQVAVLQSDLLHTIEEEDPDAYEWAEVVATFTIKIPTAEIKTGGEITKSFLLYVSGNDTYGDIAKVSRSDVNMLIAVDPVKHKMLLVNTPRDYYVQLHGTTGTRDKLTHAGNYGIEMSQQTMEDLYGLTINYNVRINFSSLTQLVDTLGGVDVDSEYAFTSQGCTFKKGINHVNGKQALAFSRARHNFAAGDITRGENQQRVIKAIVDKISGPAVLTHYTGILSSLKGTFQTTISSDEIKQLVSMQLDDLSKWDMESITVTGKGKRAATHSMGARKLYVMEPDMDSVAEAKAKIEEYLAGTEGQEDTTVTDGAVEQ
jgi:LCP family protein required for cell wall assembly